MIGQLKYISLVAGIVIPPFAVIAAYLMFLPTGRGRGDVPFVSAPQK